MLVGLHAYRARAHHEGIFCCALNSGPSRTKSSSRDQSKKMLSSWELCRYSVEILPDFFLQKIFFTMIKWERFRSIPVCMVFLAMGFVYYVTLFVFLADWIGLQSSAGSLNIAIFTFLIGFCVFSFLVCVLTDPGHVPSSYVPDAEDGEVSDHQESSKRNVSSGYFASVSLCCI